MIAKRQMSSKKVLAACAGTLCAVVLLLLSVITATELSKTKIRITDGALSVSFRTTAALLDDILAEATKHGVSPLLQDDYAEYDAGTGEIMITRRIHISITDGETTLYTQALTSTNVGQILKDNNITLPEGCFSSHKANAYVSDGDVITVGHMELDPAVYYGSGEYLDDAPARTLQHADPAICNVLIKVNNVPLYLELNKGSRVRDVLEENRIVLRGNDTVSVPLDSLICSDTVIFVKKSIGVTVTADGQTANISLNGGYVEDAIRVSGVVLGEDDFVNYPVQAYLFEDMAIRVSRVTYVERTETEEIPFDTVSIEDASMYVGQRKVIKAGVAGSQNVEYRDRYVDGVLESTEIISVEVLEEPVAEEVYVGTQRKKAIKSYSGPGTAVDSKGNSFNYTALYTGSGTAYYGGGITATGRPAQYGVVAVDPKIIPYGSRLYIVSCDGRVVYGYCIAGDTGGFAWDGSAIVDLYYDTYEQCVQFGRRDVYVYVLP